MEKKKLYTLLIVALFTISIQLVSAYYNNGGIDSENMFVSKVSDISMSIASMIKQ